jgi:hypothetical protein
MRDVGYEAHLKLLEQLEKLGEKPIVLDSKEILLDPKGALTKFCERVGIPFEESMLSWAQGARPEDGVWAKHWYSNVHKSTGFKPYVPKSDPFPSRMIPLLEACQPIYERLARSST